MSCKEVRRKVERLTIKLHELIRKGLAESADAEDVRESILDIWESVERDDRAVLNGLSGDLYLISGEEDRAPGTLHDLQAIKEAWQHHAWVELLALTRRRVPALDDARCAYLRARAYDSLGLPLAAEVFFSHASALDPTNENLHYLALQALLEAGEFERAWEHSRSLLSNEPAPTLLFKIADVMYVAATFCDPTFAASLYKRVVETVDRAEQAAGAQQPLVSVRVGGLVKKAYALVHLKDANAALETLKVALRLAPQNDVVLVALGLFHLDQGRTDDAIPLFERAVSTRTPLVWPYLLLAKRSLELGEDTRCLELADQGLERGASGRVRASLLELKASAFLLRADLPAASTAMQDADAAWPLDERIQHNIKTLAQDGAAAKFEVEIDLDPRAVGFQVTGEYIRSGAEIRFASAS